MNINTLWPRHFINKSAPAQLSHFPRLSKPHIKIEQGRYTFKQGNTGSREAYQAFLDAHQWCLRKNGVLRYTVEHDGYGGDATRDWWVRDTYTGNTVKFSYEGGYYSGKGIGGKRRAYAIAHALNGLEG